MLRKCLEEECRGGGEEQGSRGRRLQSWPTDHHHHITITIIIIHILIITIIITIIIITINPIIIMLIIRGAGCTFGRLFYGKAGTHTTLHSTQEGPQLLQTGHYWRLLRAASTRQVLLLTFNSKWVGETN